MRDDFYQAYDGVLPDMLRDAARYRDFVQYHNALAQSAALAFYRRARHVLAVLCARRQKGEMALTAISRDLAMMRHKAVEALMLVRL